MEIIETGTYNSTNKNTTNANNLANLRAATSNKKTQTFRLNNGMNMPSLGLGTLARKSGSDEIIQTVKDAIDVGYRAIDCAWNYENEEDVGKGIREKVEEGVIKREDMFITSKLWNTFHHKELVEIGIRQTLKNLGVDYLDLYLVHFPTAFKGCTNGVRYPKDEYGNVIYADVDICETWAQMEQLVMKGYTKAIGVSNFNSEQLRRILKKCTIPPAVNQIEVNPYLSNRKLVDFCMKRSIRVISYSPIKTPETKSPDEPSLLKDPVLLEMSQRYRRTVAQVILRWVLQRGVIVIPKSVKKYRLEENIDVFNFHLSDEDMHKIYQLNRNLRTNPFKEQAGNHPEYPFNIEF